MRYILLLVILVTCFALSAQAAKTVKPETNPYLALKGVQKDGTTTTGNLIDLIAVKLGQIDSEYISKLKKEDRQKAADLMIEVNNLLSLLPTTQKVNVIKKETADSLKVEKPVIKPAQK